MKRKVVGMLVCMLLILTVVSTVSAGQQKKVIKNCYLELKGPDTEIYHMTKFFNIPFNNGQRLVFFWIVQWLGEKETITVYDHKGGSVIWKYEGVQQGIWASDFFLFRGQVTWTNESGTSMINLQGTVKGVTILWDE